MYVLCQQNFLPLSLPEIAPRYEVKVHIWKILLFFLVGALEKDRYGEESKEGFIGSLEQQGYLGIRMRIH